MIVPPCMFSNFNPLCLNFRYMESGCYRGFFPKALELLRPTFHGPDANILPWQLYTDKDFTLHSPSSSFSKSNYFHSP